MTVLVLLRQRPAINWWWAHRRQDKVNQDPEEVEHLIALKDMSTWAVRLCGACHLQYDDYEVCLLWHVNSLNKNIVYVTAQNQSQGLFFYMKPCTAKLVTSLLGYESPWRTMHLSAIWSGVHKAGMTSFVSAFQKVLQITVKNLFYDPTTPWLNIPQGEFDLLWNRLK